MFPITTTAVAAVVAWEKAMFPFPPLVEQDPCLTLSGIVEKIVGVADATAGM